MRCYIVSRWLSCEISTSGPFVPGVKAEVVKCLAATKTKLIYIYLKAGLTPRCRGHMVQQI